MTQRPITQHNKNKNTNKKFYPKKKNGKKSFWKDYKNSSTNKNETQNSHHTFTTKEKWSDKKKNYHQRSTNSNKNFHLQQKQNWKNNSNKPYYNSKNKYNKKNNSKINSVPFRLKNFPDSERTAYNLKKNRKFETRIYDSLFLQQYAKNERTGASIYVKPPTKHNILYPFILNLNLINEYIKKR